jgi:hypothetical protein
MFHECSCLEQTYLVSLIQHIFVVRLCSPYAIPYTKLKVLQRETLDNKVFVGSGGFRGRLFARLVRWRLWYPILQASLGFAIVPG